MVKNKAVKTEGSSLVETPPKLNVLTVDTVAVPMEPRVMLDANLEWDLNGTTAITSVMSGIAQLFDDTFDDVTDFLEEFEGKASVAFDAVSALVDTAEELGSPDLNAVGEAIDRIKQAIDDVKEGSLTKFTNLLGGTFSTDVATALNSYLEAQNNPPAMGDPAFVGTAAAPSIDTLFTIANLQDGTVGADIDAYLTALDTGSVSSADARAAFDTIVTDQLGFSGAGSNFGFELQDIELNGSDVVTFTAGAGGVVDVDVDLPQVVADFTGMLLQALPGGSLPFDFEFLGSSTDLLSFQLSTDTSFTGDILDDITLNINEFSFAPLLQVGGALTLPANAGLSIGFLELGVTGVETAQLKLEVVPSTDMNLGGKLTFTGTPGLEFFGSTASVSVEAMIQDLDATTFSTIATDASYSLLSVDFDGSLEFSAVQQAFTAGVTLSSVLDSSGPAGRIQEFINAVDFDFEFAMTDGSLSAGLQETLEQTLFTLITLGSEEISGFIKDVGETISNALLDKALDIELPLTDLRLGNLLAEMSAVFSGLVDTFSIPQSALGFVDVDAIGGVGGSTDTDVVADTAFSQEVDSQLGSLLTDGQLANLLDYKDITLSVLDATGAVTDFTLNLLGTDVLDVSKTNEERMASLAGLMNTLLSGQGIAVALAGNLGLRITSTQNAATGGNPPTYNSLAVTSARKTDNSTDDGFSLNSLGFSASNLLDQAETFGVDTVEKVLRFTVATTTAELGTLDVSALDGVKNLRFGIIVDGVEQFVDVVSSTGWTSVADVASDFTAALAAKDLGLSVGLNAASDGLSFSLAADELRSVVLNQDTSQLLRALDIEGLIDWVNDELDDKFPGSNLALTEDGELIFTFPDITQTLAISDADGVYLSTSDLDLGILQGLELSGTLTAQIEATLSTAIGIDLVGFGNDVIGTSGAANLSEANKSFVGNLGDAVMDNVFLNDLSLVAEIDATASSISGAADLGILKITVGGDDPTKNFAHVNAQFDANLLGTNATGEFNEQLTFSNLRDAVVDKIILDSNNDPLLVKAAGISTLLGRFEVLGGIVIDGEGRGLNAAGDVAETAADVVVVDDAFGYAGTDELAQLLVNIGDVSVDVAGIPGITDDIVEGVSLTIVDLADIVQTYDVALISDNPAAAEAIEGLTNLDDGDILDTLVAIANVLVVVGETLADKLPFLDTDLPLLNISILDQISFSADFLNGLQELRNDPQSGLDKIEAELEKVFGTDTVSLTWVPADKTILFDLSFDFLEEYQKTIPFQIDLAELLGAELATLIGPELASVVSGLVDASGDGELIFDPKLSLNFSFGIDLSPTLVEPTDIIAANAALGSLATVSSVNLRPGGGNDLRLIWTDTNTSISKSFEIDLDGLETLDAVVGAINTQAQAEFGATVSVTFDATSGQITISDSDNEIIIDTSVIAMFGAASVDGVEDTGIFSITLDSGFADFAGEQAFTINIGDEPVAITIPAEAARDKAGFVAAFNAALAETTVLRSAISDTAAPFITIALSQLMKVEVNGAGEIVLQGTNFAAAADFDAIAFSVSGDDQSEEIAFSLIELGGSNVGRMLGFDNVDGDNAGDVRSEVLFEAVTASAPRVYLDTSKTAIRAEFIAGVNDGLNIQLGLGPLTIQVQNGKALVNAGDGSGDAAYVSLGIADIDGDANVDEYDLSHLFSISADPNLGFADLFNLDAKIGIDIDLPFSDTLGIFDPSTDGVKWTASLLSLPTGFNFGDVDTSDLLASFEGELVNLYLGNSIDLSSFTLELPISDIENYLSNFNVLGLLNDPRAILGGLDVILNQMQTLFDDYLSDIKLPVVGDAIGAGVTFFDEFRYNIIQPALEYASTPLADGSLPTTVDLITGFLNEQLHSLFGTNSADFSYIQAFLDTSGATEDSYIYGTLNFNAVIFDEMLDIDFDFGIPGFDMEVEQGSKIQMLLTYGVNIGFGSDRNGFFLLNDTDANEISVDFTVDAGTFEGSMSVFDILGLSAKAASLNADGTLNAGAAGTALITASLGADLYGDTGLEIVDPATQGTSDAITATQAFRDFSGVNPLAGNGSALEWERVVYVAQLDTGNLIAFEFTATIDVVIALQGNILDPTTGEPVKILGKEVIPSVNAELVFNGMYNTTDGLQLNELAFKNVRLDASVLYEALIKPILDPIMEFIEPLAGFFQFLNSEPISFIVDLLGNVFPIIKIVDTVSTIIDDILQFVVTLNATNGQIIFGDFDFSSNIGDLQSGETTMSNIDRRDIARDTTGLAPPANKFGIFGDRSSGLSIELPLLTDPFSAMSILTGNFDQVDLVRARFTLFNLDTGVIDIGALVLDSIGAPGWVQDIISSVFSASIEARLVAKFEAGYDLSGLVNFANTMDPERLLDGVFIESSPGSLIDAYIGASVSLNAGIAGLTTSGYAGVQLAFNDPNNDGKLRIPELIAIVEAAAEAVGDGDPLDALGYIFKGTASYGFKLSVWAGINLPWPLPDLKWSTTVFDFSDSIPFGGNQVDARMSTEIENAGDTAILNVGARVGGSFSTIQEDGNDIITVAGPNSPIQVSLSSGGKSISGEVSETAGAIIIPAGEGNNVVTLTDVKNGIPTITYTGGGNDTIRLPKTGLHVVFAGDGKDKITAAAGSTGTYVIFGEGGEDIVDIPGGNVVFFGDSDFEMRDRFLVAFASNKVTEAGMLALLGMNLDGTVNASAGTNYTLGGAKVNLDTLLDQFTVATQKKSSSVEKVTLGSGNHIVMTGDKNDEISVALNGSGVVKILSGGGDDVVTAGGSDVFIEGGAGRDLIQVDGANTEVWGWAAAGGEEGLIAGDANLNSYAFKDGADVLVGGSGDDKLFGQLGSDIIEGRMGADTLGGGLDNDFITGGVFDIMYKGAMIDITTFDITGSLTSSLTISTQDIADGDDIIRGGKGADVLIGGGGGDTIDGGDDNDALIGDFGEVQLASNLIAEGAITNYISSANAGTDSLSGGRGGDLLVAGAAAAGETETLSDLFGSNTLLGDFGQIEGARILEYATKVTSIASAMGGADTMETGRGNDVHIGGEGNDIIKTGLGGDIVLGDLGIIDITHGTITGLADARDGNDMITLGIDTPLAYVDPDTAALIPASPDLVDLVISSLGDDTVNSAEGDLHLVADAGTLSLEALGLAALRTYAPIAATADQATKDANERALQLISSIFKSSASVANVNDGKDTLINTGGDVSVILGGGEDTATLADGVNYVMGDDGTIEVLFNQDYSGRKADLATADSLAASNVDTITAGNGENFVAAGMGGDTITLGNGQNLVLADRGTISRDARTALPTTDAVSTSQTGDGNDTVTVGDGVNTIIGGGGDDGITAGSGGNFIAGDSARVALTTTTTMMTSEDNTIGGIDTINSGTGADTIIAGFGADTVLAGNGDNTVIGDRGIVSQNAGRGANVTITAETLSQGVGSNDTITTLAGNDIVFGGAASDTISSGGGQDVVHGDDGKFISSAANGKGRLTSAIQTSGGNDDINAGNGNDLVIGGLGADKIAVGNGNDVAMGDDATVIFRNFNDVESFVTTNENRGGNDRITAAGKTGDNVLIGQAGSDTVFGGDSDDLIVGDLLTAKLESVLKALPGQSVVDRILNITSTRIDVAGDDVVNAGDGADIVIGGFGADTLKGEGGQDILVGETVIYNRTFQKLSSGGLIESLTLDTNFAFELGGYDQISGGAGADIMIGGLGPDLFFGDTAGDLIFSDAYAGTFTATWSNAGFLGDTGFRELLTSNFPGTGALDVVSAAQQDASIGAPLEVRNAGRDTGFFVDDFETGQVISLPNGFVDPDVVNDVLSYLESSAVLAALAELSVAGVDQDILMDALLAALIAEFGAAFDINSAAYEAMLNQVVAYVLARLASAADDGQADDETPQAALLSIAAE